MDKKVVLELIGIDGNAYAILGAFQRAARRQKFDADWIQGVMDLATSGDYSNLLRVMMDNTVPPEDED